MSGISLGDNTLYDASKGPLENRLYCMRDKRRSNINAGIGVLTTTALGGGAIYMARKHSKGYNDFAKFIGKYIEKGINILPEGVKTYVKKIANKETFVNIKNAVVKTLKDAKILSKTGKLKHAGAGKAAIITAGAAVFMATINYIFKKNAYNKGRIDQSYEDAQAINGAYAMGKAEKGYEIAAQISSRIPRKLYF